MGTALALTVFLTTCWSRGADLVVDGGGTYSVSNNVTFYNAYIGNFLTGTVDQSGFANTITNNLYLGYSPGSSGAYNLSGGDLSTGNDFIGTSGSGVFTQTGGNHNVGANLVLGFSTGSSGVYNQSGGDNTAIVLILGNVPGTSGTYNQSGGTLSVSSYSYLGLYAGSSGAYNLSAGSLSQFRQYVGLHGSGVFNQSGGSNAVNHFDIYSGLYLGYWGDSSGAYNLSNGSLTAPFETIGVFGLGVLNQSNGANKMTGDLCLGYGRNSSGAYYLSGGSLAVDNEVIGLNGHGAFTQTGGTHTITHDLVLAAFPGSTASFSFLGGTLSVGGDYTQNAAGSLALGIAAAADYQRINIGGAASLNGTLTPVLLGGFRPQGNQVYSGVLAATGGLTGTLTLTDPQISPTLFWQPRYSANRLDLLVQRDYNNPGLGLNSNQQAVGAGLNGVATSAGGDLNSVLTAIDSLSSGSMVANAFKQISPDKATALPALAFAGTNLQMRNLSRRVTNLRFGGPEMDAAAGLPGSFNPSYSRAAGLMLAYNSSSLTGLLTAKKEAAPETRWGLYLDPGLILGSQKSSLNQTGFDFTLAGFTTGADYRVRDNLLVGLATGYAHTGAAFHGSGGNVAANTWPLTAYAAYLPESFYAFGSLGYALNLYDLGRDISFGSLNRNAKSSPTGNQLNAYGETGYDLKAGGLVVTPVASLAYSRLWVDGFTEGGAGALDLKVSPQNAASLQTGVGAKVAVSLPRGPVRVVPQFYATYQHEFSNDSRGLDARLSQSGSTFAFQTDKPQRDFAVVGTSVTLLKQNYSLQLDYNAEVGRSNATAHSINAGLRWAF